MVQSASLYVVSFGNGASPKNGRFGENRVFEKGWSLFIRGLTNVDETEWRVLWLANHRVTR